LTETVSTDCSARTVAFAAFSPFADDPGTAEVGRFSPLPTPRNSVFLTEWNGRFLAESCPSCLEPQTSILSPGKAGIRRVWRDNSFTQYPPIPQTVYPPRHPFSGRFRAKKRITGSTADLWVWKDFAGCVSGVWYRSTAYPPQSAYPPPFLVSLRPNGPPAGK